MSAVAWLLVLAVVVAAVWVVGAVAGTRLARDIARLCRNTRWYIARYRAVTAWHVRRLTRRA